MYSYANLFMLPKQVLMKTWGVGAGGGSAYKGSTRNTHYEHQFPLKALIHQVVGSDCRSYFLTFHIHENIHLNFPRYRYSILTFFFYCLFNNQCSDFCVKISRIDT